MTFEHQDPHDAALAARIQELKPPGCTCDIATNFEGFTDKPTVYREDNLRCPIHYPLTSATLNHR